MVAALVLASHLLTVAAGHDPQLVGNWGLAGAPFLSLQSDGSASMAGEACTWTSDGKQLHLRSQSGEADDLAYQLQGGQLQIVAGGMPMSLTRLGAPPAPAGHAAKDTTPLAPASPTPAATKGASAEGSKLLLSSAWCSFHYNKVSGASSTSRVVFSPDGTWAKAHRGEGYSSGVNGTYASQHNSGDAGRWKLEGGVFSISSSQTNDQLVPLAVGMTRNSQGYPIFKVNGEEYSMCQ